MLRLPLSFVLVLMLLANVGLGQDQETTFRSVSPLVIAHTTVRDEQGKYDTTLEPEDFHLLVEGKPVPFDLDYSFVPISLVVVVETCKDCGAAIKKLRKVGSLIEPLVTGERGEVAMLQYSSSVRQVQPFLRGADGISQSFASLRPGSSNDAVLYDALAEAVKLVAPRLRGRRGVILHLGESIDRGSKRTFQETANLLEQNNILLYSVTYSRLKTAFADREAWKDRTGDSEFYEEPEDGIIRTPPPNAPYGFPDAPPPMSPGQVVSGHGNARMPGPASGPSYREGNANLLALFQLLGDAARKNAASQFAKLTGGEEMSFNRQGSLEKAIARIGEELHSQYLLSFRPPLKDPESYYRIEVKLKKPGKQQVRTRPGYWMAAER
jgi:VWFA-related protein